MKKLFVSGVLLSVIVVLASQDPFIVLPEWCFMLALAVGVVITLMCLALSALLALG